MQWYRRVQFLKGHHFTVFEKSHKKVSFNIASEASYVYNIKWSCQKCQKSSTLRAFENLKLGVKQCYQIDIRTRCKGHGVFLLAFGPSGFRRYLIKSRAITVGKIPPAAKNICKMSGGRYPMHIKLPYNQPTSPPYTTQKFLWQLENIFDNTDVRLS